MCLSRITFITFITPKDFACSDCHHLSQICVGNFYHTLSHHQHDHEEALAKRRSSSFYMVVENDFLATRVLCKDNFLHTSFSSFSHYHHFIITNLKLSHLIRIQDCVRPQSSSLLTSSCLKSSIFRSKSTNAFCKLILLM